MKDRPKNTRMGFGHLILLLPVRKKELHLFDACLSDHPRISAVLSGEIYFSFLLAHLMPSLQPASSADFYSVSLLLVLIFF